VNENLSTLAKGDGCWGIMHIFKVSISPEIGLNNFQLLNQEILAVSIARGYFFFYITEGIWVSLRAPQLISGPLNILQVQWACKTSRGWQTCTKRIEPKCRKRKQVFFPARPWPQVRKRVLFNFCFGWFEYYFQLK